MLLRRYFFIALLIQVSFFSFAQCDCYTVTDLELPDNKPGILEVTFMNTCDNNVYFHAWVITEQNDTIARFDECLCGHALPLNTPSVWDFKTQLSGLPAPGAYRVSIDNGTLTCGTVAIDLVTGTEDEAKNAFTILPNPAGDLLRVEFETEGDENRVISLLDLSGKVLLESRSSERSVAFDISPLAPGMYLINVSAGRHEEVRRFVRF